ncbi:hypothetical protein [Halomonas elongata]|uniref:Uncharacterized protein n=1 Tax=Halomonas elongata (strain ATCC 33173 / DSM 2581 / NBRC 15536 / NCIMB 2198 / 1H9) TaxID=768066 RepID=E1V337_HALED|nr:hypothetical protein [Halomonas elongata]WBF19794.1 hypothetical protein LM502_08945 [Halomonas elongata]WPU48663.1 hypothetical protein SR933_07170 [Halomonas elongata DSM 2581]CBV42516.1 uncharacterized protein HELO_2632 [Halomonas elongata DSM 2581]
MSGGGGGSTDIEDTPEQRHMAEVAAEKWNYAQEQLAPLENEYMQDVGQMTTPSRMGYIEGQASQGQMQATHDLMGEASGKLNQAGIDPSSGRAQSVMTGLSLDAAEAGGSQMGRGQFEQENQQVQGLQNIVAMGQGESGQAQAGLSTVASYAQSDARSDAVQSFNRRSANLQLLGQVAGAGTRYGLDQIGGNSAAGLGLDTGVNQDAIDASIALNRG